MLDTDICSYVLKTKSESLAKTFESHVGRIAISEVVLAELRFGADNHPHRSVEIHELIDDFTARLEVIPWAASATYGRIRSELQKAGTPIGNLDTLIAAHAVALKLTLVTNNLRHFSRVPQLSIEQWQ
jgi:tRNA(fMet)-specific endonuclease VapC